MNFKAAENRITLKIMPTLSGFERVVREVSRVCYCLIIWVQWNKNYCNTFIASLCLDGKWMGWNSKKEKKITLQLSPSLSKYKN